MTERKSRVDRNLTKLRVALAAGGLAVTILGADLLGKQADAATVAPAAVNTPQAETSGATTIEALDVDELNLELEAIPTVTAPAFRNNALARGRSSG